MTKRIEILPDWPQWKREIAERINELGWSMKEASTKAQLGETWVRDTLKRDKDPTQRNLTKIKAALGILHVEQPSGVDVNHLQVMGRAQAGAFLDVSMIDDVMDREVIQVARDLRYPRARQYALLVVGDSMNKLFDDGSYVTCVDWAESGLGLRQGMCLHVERHNGALIEVTIKSLDLQDDQWVLKPLSSNPVHKPIRLDEDQSAEVIVKGLVTGSWKPITY